MRLDETRRDKRRDETRQDTRNQETRRDETRHFRNRIFRSSERRRITLRKQYTLDPTLSWTLRITFSGGQNALQADNEASYHVVDDFRPGITTSHCSTLRRHENVILQGLWDPRIIDLLPIIMAAWNPPLHGKWLHCWTIVTRLSNNPWRITFSGCHALADIKPITLEWRI